MSSLKKPVHHSQQSKISETLLSLTRSSLPEPSYPPADASISQLGNRHQSDCADSDSDRDESSAHQDLARCLQRLQGAINSLSVAPKSTSSIKTRTPDVFDGSDPGKLDKFLFQCSMYIAAHSGDFLDQESHVSFALSYLQDVPLDWFQGEVTRALHDTGNLPTWFASYPDFISELRRIFGPQDPVTDAIEALEALQYEDSTKAARYTVDFNRHALRTGWNDVALVRLYYKGLPARLKDDIARIGKPATLTALQGLVATLDARHWERHSEIHHEQLSTPSEPTPHALTHAEAPAEIFVTNPAEDSLNNDAEDLAECFAANFAESSAENHPENSPDLVATDSPLISPAIQPADSPALSPSSLVDHISDILDANGKLKPEERQRCLVNVLCLYCGEPGHMVNDCPRNPSGILSADSGSSSDVSELDAE